MDLQVGDNVHYNPWQMQGWITELYKPLGTFTVAKVAMANGLRKDCFLYHLDRSKQTPNMANQGRSILQDYRITAKSVLMCKT